MKHSQQRLKATLIEFSYFNANTQNWLISSSISIYIAIDQKVLFRLPRFFAFFGFQLRNYSAAV